MTNNENNSDKKRLRVYYGMLITVLCIIGVSFAWFRLYLSQSENNTIASRTCFSTTLTEDTEKIALTDAFPLTDTDGLKETPFTFTIKNNCASYVKAYITIDSEYRTSTSSSYLSDNYIKVNLSPSGTTSSPSVILGGQTLIDIDNSRKGYILNNVYLKANEEKTYDLRLWMDAAVTVDQGLNKSWAGKIVVVTSASNEPTLSEKILADNVVQKSISTPGYEPSAYTIDDVITTSLLSVSSSGKSYYVTYADGYVANGYKIDLTGAAITSDTYANSYASLVGKYLPYSFFSNSAGTMKSTTNLDIIYYVVSATADSITYKEIHSNKNVTEALLSSAEDDYGTSYYFRGLVKNNYVEFANMCWRIVRVTGDGSVKLILHNNNLNGVSSPCLSVNNSNAGAFAKFSDTVNRSVFNTNGDDNAYVGFMYGTPGSTTYESAQVNTNKSEILINLETWYNDNLSSYENKLADVIWCNDKSIPTDNSINMPMIGQNETNFGYGINVNGYGALVRLIPSGDNRLSPSLKCPNDNNGGKLSKFTVSDTINGNGDLDYKIGLLTMDEAIFAGNYSFDDGFYNYLWENTGGMKYWTMTPLWFTDVGSEFALNKSRIAQGATEEPVTLGAYIRPSIALKADVQISSGSGTSDDPYIIK